MKALLITMFFMFFYVIVSRSQDFEVVLKQEHKGQIKSIAFTNDGLYFATAGSDNTLKLWETKSGLLIRTFLGHTEAVNCLDFNSSYSLIVSGSNDGTLKLWDTYTGICLRTISAHKGWVNIARFALNDSIIISGSGDWKAGDHWTKYWNPYNGSIVDSILSKNISSADISSDGKLIVCGHGNAPVRLFDIRSRTLLATLEGHKLPYRQGDVEAIAFSRDNRYIVSAGCDDLIKIWDRDSKTYIQTLKGHQSNIASLAISHDGKNIVSVDRKNNLKLWDWESGACLRSISVDHETRSLCFKPNDNYLYSAGEKLSKWEIPSLTPAIENNNEKTNLDDIICLSTVGGKDSVLSVYHDGTINIWDLSVCQPRFIQRDTGLHFPRVSILDPTEQYIATSTGDAVRIWKIGQQKVYKEINKKNAEFILFEKTGTQIYVTGADEIDVFSMKKKNTKRIKSLKGHNTVSPSFFSSSISDMSNAFNGIDINGKNDVLMSANMDGLNQWNLKNGTYSGRLINEDGPVFATNDGPFHTRMDHGGPVFSVRFSQDGKTIAYGDFDHRVKLRDAFNGSLLHSFEGHADLVDHLNFSPDGRFLASSDWNGAIRVWNLHTMAAQCALPGHSMGINSLAFTKDSRFLLSGGKDGVMIVWDVEQAEEAIKIINLGGNGYVIFCGKYYFTNKKDITNIAFSKGLKVYPFEQMDLKYNRPDIVVSRLGYASEQVITAMRRAYQKRLKKIGFTEAMLTADFQVPEIKINIADLPTQIPSPGIEIPIRANDAQYTLDRINVFINDVPIYGISGIDLISKNTQQYEQTLKLTLSPGENKIQISALNQAGAESLKETFYVTCTAPERKPDLYVIGIGVGKFKTGAMNLNYPAKDVTDLAQFFQKDNAVYGKVIVDTVLDASLSPARLKALKTKLMSTRVDDHVVLFVAGHGILDDSLDYYFGTYNTDFNHPKTQAIPYEALEDLLDGIPARQKLMLMDACHAGEIDKENVVLTQKQTTSQGTIQFRALGNQAANRYLGLENSFELMKELFVDLRRGTGATVIASAGGVESAMEGDLWNNSVFMYTLLSGLQDKKADGNKDGAVTVSELQNYLGPEVERLTKGAQRPVFRAENVANDWRVW